MPLPSTKKKKKVVDKINVNIGKEVDRGEKSVDIVPCIGCTSTGHFFKHPIIP
jgi:hypothetical protein